MTDTPGSRTDRDIRLVAFDLDGTLLHSDKTVSARTRSALAALRERGIRVVPCTGRVYQGLLSRVLGMEGLVDHVVAANGAVVLDVGSRRFLRHDTIEAERAAALVERLHGPGIVGYACLDDEEGTRLSWCHSEEDYLRVRGTRSWSERIVERGGDPAFGVAGRIRELGVGALKVGVHYARPWAHPDLEALARELGLECASSDLNNVEFSPTGATKATGLSLLCDSLGIPLAHVCAFGDAGNDAAMLRSVGLGVAMGNASDEAIVAARTRTLTNDEDGVAAFIERRVLAE